MIATQDRVRIVETRVLSDDWYLLKKTTFDFLRRDGVWQRQSRETYDRGDGATILLFNRQRQKVVLTRQFRFPAFVNGHDGMLIEAAAGLLDNASPEERIRAEAEGEDLDVLELPLADALRAVSQGTIVDAKTIMLLQFVALNHTLEKRL